MASPNQVVFIERFKYDIQDTGIPVLYKTISQNTEVGDSQKK